MHIRMKQPLAALDDRFDKSMVVAAGFDPEAVVQGLFRRLLEACFAHDQGVEEAVELGLQHRHEVFGVDELGV